jgi:hypothetical protein
MTTHHLEQRHYDRRHHETSIKYGAYHSDKYHGAKMYNYSMGGMCFITNAAIQPGSDICVKMEGYSSEMLNMGTEPNAGYRGEVVWCSEVSGIYASYHGQYEVGIQFYDTLNQDNTNSKKVH